ncbi:S8 family peptidase [Adhaeribacter sp. BT258]|uniref:S8 family peptidase n=1 Tax=Adhaeribacter terrigena TaxID=2793070 RepID=A0ABS1BYX1_9BACT|nr:S8/S53 family peptidase [Adhaeribacter terrigena]MBK0402346.1 S8 family peptidase [Adhaeribacter terrigena]
MHRFYFLLLLLLPFLSNYTAQAQSPAAVKSIPGKLVFKLKPEYKAFAKGNTIQLPALTQALATIKAGGLHQKFPKATLSDKPEAVDLTLLYEVKLDKNASLENAMKILLKTGVLAYVEKLNALEPLFQSNDPLADSTAANTQYHLKNIRAYRGWDFEQGDTAIVIGILDTGIRYSHKDLQGNLKYNYADPVDGIDNDNDGYVDNFRGWDLADNDNDATANLNGHGVGVTGVASAITQNNKGVAGVGFKSKFLPLKIYPSTATGTFAGYEAIVFAADHGCDVINLSWGGFYPASLYEQDVVNYAAINKNRVVVAAAGNTSAKLDFYPASYKNVISVGTTDQQNVKGLTYGHRVDVVAPGFGIITTTNSHDSAYAQGNGSSYACPMVAGTAALVKKKFPQFNAQQIAEQIRATANAGIYNLPGNASAAGQLGHGLLDVAKALSTTNAKAVRYTQINPNKKGVLHPGDTLYLTVDFKNYLAPLANLNVVVSAASPHVTVLQGSFPAGAMATLSTKTTAIPFSFVLAANTPVNEKIAIRFEYTDGTFTDSEYFEMFLNPDFVTIDVNEVDVTITSRGNIGYNDMNPEQGEGVRYKLQNLLAEGGFMVGSSPTKVSDNVRNEAFDPDGDFYSLNNVHFVNALPRADMMAEGMMQDSFPQRVNNVGVKVFYKGMAWQNAPNDKFVILEYQVINPGTDTLQNLYAGMYADWDVIDAARNVAAWDSVHKMGYVRHTTKNTHFAGMKLITPGAPSFYAFEFNTPPAGTIDISNGFTNAEKYQALAGGVARKTAGSLAFGNDVSYVIGAKLPDLAPTDTAIIALAILAGDSLADLQASAQAAQLQYYAKPNTGIKPGLATQPISVYPNPASELLHLELPKQFSKTNTHLELLNMVGKSVAFKTIKAGTRATLNVSQLAPGLYVLRVRNNGMVQTQKIQIVR